MKKMKRKLFNAVFNNQAIKSIELWTGIHPSFEDMYNKCKEILEGKLNNE